MLVHTTVSLVHTPAFVQHTVAAKNLGRTSIGPGDSTSSLHRVTRCELPIPLPKLPDAWLHWFSNVNDWPPCLHKVWYV